MRTESLPQLPKPLPRIIVGTASMGTLLPGPLASQSSKADTLRLLDEMVDIGCTAFDTAAIYQAGGTERLLGEWLSARRNRDKLFLITKGAHPNVVLQSSRFNAKALTEDLHASLQRLRTDSIELYLLHRDDPSKPLDEVLDLLARFQGEGKIRSFGVSNWTLPRLESAARYLRDHNQPPLAANSPHFSLLEWVRTPWPGTQSLAGAGAKAAREFHAKTQLPVLAWSALGHGFFSDRITETTKPGLFDLQTRSCLKAYGSPSNFGRKKRAEELATKHGVSSPQVALAYLFHQPFPVFAIVASSSAARMKKNIEASELSLTEAEIRYLETGEGP